MYTILNNNLQVKGKLTLDNGQGSTAFFGDAITQQIATDNSTDPNNLTTQAFNETDKQGNSKSWGHSLTLSVENTALGSSITTADSILYLDNVSNKYYLMKIIDISGDRNSGFRTINAVNTAVYELGKKLFNTEKTYTKASLADVVNDVYKDVPFSLRIEDDLETVIDYTISAGTSAQAIFQDLQTKYDVDIDSWVELDNSGNLSERVLYFGHLGTDNGELIRYGGAKGFENITAQEVSDTIYTKLWVNGQTDDKNPNNGHIGSVNNGLEYIVDDDANAHEYPIGANQQQPAYLEGIITNNLLSEPQALLDWSQIQMSIFNHARFNYTVTPLHDQVVGIGDIVAVQDFHMQPMILVTSKVIQKVTSFASPETNTFVLGEFSNIFTEQLNKNSNVITLIKKDVTVVQEAADNARVAADEAHKQAVIAQSKAIQAQATANGKATAFTVSSLEDLPKVANEGDIAWVNSADGTYGYTYINGKWVEDINPHLEQQITDGVNTSIQTAKQNTDKVVAANNILINKTINDVSIQQANNEIDKRNFEAKAQDMVDKGVSDAKADNKAVATQTLASANANLNQAKQDLTTNLNKEVADRQAVITALDTKSTSAVNQAKQDARDAINALSVGGRNLLLNTDEDKIIKPITDGWQINFNYWVAYENLISGKTYSLSLETKLTRGTQFNVKVFTKDNQTELLSTVLTADNSRQVWTFKVPDSGSNLLIYSGLTGDTKGITATIHHAKLEEGSLPTDWTQAPEDVVQAYTNADNQIKQTFTQYKQTNDGAVSKARSDATQSLTQVATKVSQSDYDKKTGDLSTKYTQVKQTADGNSSDIVAIKKANGNQDSKINSVVSDVDSTKRSISDIQTTQGTQSSKINQITDDVNGTKQSITAINTANGQQNNRIATIETSVDGVKSDFTTYTKSNDGKVIAAQTTAQTAVDGLKAKVSKSDYDKKTGELSTKVGNAQLTADKATTTIGNYQKSNDNRVKATETDIDQNANDIQLRATKQDLNNATGNLNTAIGKVDVRAGQVESSVSELSNTVNSMGQINQLMNTEFNPDLSNWAFNNTNSNNPYRGYVDKSAGATTVGFNTLNASDNSFARFVQLIPVSTFASSASISVSWQSYTTDISLYNNLWIHFLDSSGATINGTNRQWTNLRADGTMVAKSWERQKWENISIPDGTTTVRVSFEAREGTRAYLVRPMVVFSDTIGSYTAGNYNNNDKIALQQLTIDGITQTVSSQGSNINSITKRVQTAEGTLSTATDNISGLSSKTNQMAGQFNQEISDRKNGDSNTLSSAQNYTTSQIQGYDSGLQTQLTQTSSAFLATVSASNLVLDSSLMDSAFSGSIVNWIPSGAGKWYYSPGVSYQGIQSMGYNQSSLNGDYSSIESQPWGVNSFSGSTLNVSVDVRANNIGGTSNDYLIVYLMEYDSSGALVVQTNITGTIRDSNSSWVNYRKKITINPNSKKFFIRYQMRGNGNVYVARPYVGVQELIDGGYTAGTNNNNQTILSLFKDNWSIGIADNLSTITNGIVGTPSNLSVISKNVTIDSPQTQINGKAWIKSADIANGAIGNAQIGDASISSAKIANLDASKISGGTISGVDFLVNKSITIASGGVIQSDVVNMGKTSFNVTASNVTTQRISPNGYALFGKGNFVIDSKLGLFGSEGVITVTMPGASSPYKTGTYSSQYGINSINLSAQAFNNGEPNETIDISSSSINVMKAKPDTPNSVSAFTGITAGNVSASDSVASNGTVSSKHIMLNDTHGIVMLDNVDLYLLGANGNPVGMHGKSWSNSSLRSMKEYFSNVDPKYALDEVLKTDIKSYNFIGDDITDNYVSPIIDDTKGEFYIPKDFIDSTGKGVKTYSIDGYLIQSIKALQEQITELKQG